MQPGLGHGLNPDLLRQTLDPDWARGLEFGLGLWLGL